MTRVTDANPFSAARVSPSTIVIGGGVAGMAAALRLAEAGAAVTLLEAADRLGGRATSAADPTDHPFDDGRHVLMGCCTNVIDLYTRLGVIDQIDWHARVSFADPCGRIDTLEADDLPAPLHLARSVLAMKTLTAAEKLAIGRGMLAILQVGSHGRRYLRDISFAQWLTEQGQPHGAIRKFWTTLIVIACNESPWHVAARYGVQVFQEGLLSHELAYRIGLPRSPLVELYRRTEQAMIKAGICILKNTAAVGFDFDGHRIAAVRIAPSGTTSHDKLRADAYISAIPFDQLDHLTSELMRISDPRLQALGELHLSPLVEVHLFFKDVRPARRGDADPPCVVVTDSPVQWMLNRGVVRTGPRAGCVHLHAVMGAAYDWVDLPSRDLAALAHARIRPILPTLAAADPVDHRVIRGNATLSPRPGVDRFRPSAAGTIENLLLAGDWVDTGWPAILEGAVRSGYRAAAAVLRLQHHSFADTDLLAPNLRPSPLYRFMIG